MDLKPEQIVIIYDKIKEMVQKGTKYIKKL